MICFRHDRKRRARASRRWIRADTAHRRWQSRRAGGPASGARTLAASPFPTSWCATRKKATSIIGPGPAVARTTRHRPVARRGRYVVDVDSDFDGSEWCHFLLLLPVPI